MEAYVDDAVAKGAAIINQNAGRVSDTAFFPAVLYPVTDEMAIFHEEQFGPVVPIVEYEDLEEVMTSIAASDYGQQCSLFSDNELTIAYAVDNMVTFAAKALRLRSSRRKKCARHGGCSKARQSRNGRRRRADQGHARFKRAQVLVRRSAFVLRHHR